MSIITDGLLIATCLTAALYCIVLSRRLARFSDTETGIGQQIAQLNAILEETRTSTKESQAGAKSVSERLARDLSGAKKATQDLAALIERAEAALDRDFERKDRAPRPQAAEEPIMEKAKPVEVAPQEEPLPEPISSAVSPIEEQSIDDIAERDFDLADARGEPQLGFLPNVTDTSSISDLSLDDDNEPQTEKEQSTPEDEENLLKVERMAL